MRTVVLVAAGIGLLVEAVMSAWTLFALSEAVGAYSMSMGGAPVGPAQWALRVLMVLLAGGLAVLGVLVALAARSTRTPRLYAALGVQSVLVVVAGTALGSIAFASTLLVLGLLFYALLAVPDPAPPAAS